MSCDPQTTVDHRLVVLLLDGPRATIPVRYRAITKGGGGCEKLRVKRTGKGKRFAIGRVGHNIQLNNARAANGLRNCWFSEHYHLQRGGGGGGIDDRWERRACTTMRHH